MTSMWLPGPGQTWLGAGASFVAMWTVMMIAMMSPSVAQIVRRADGPPPPRLRRVRRTAVDLAGYLGVWALVGVAVFPVGAGVTMLMLEQPAFSNLVPFAIGVVMLVAGALQLSQWKARHLECCREARGLRLGLHCVLSCTPMTIVLLVIGVMDLRAMAVVTAAITAERLAPAGQLVARAIGVVTIAAGILTIYEAP